MPIDPLSGGTWVAVNDAGVALTLLNVNVGPARDAMEPTSRGLIIPKLLDCDAAAEAVDRAGGLDPRAFQPFRLVILDGREVYEVRSADQRRLAVAALGPPDAPASSAAVSNGACEAWFLKGGREAGRLFSSSGLGDDVADRPRRRLWRAMTRAASGDELLNVQERFHRQRWTDRPELSVSMRRPDARTVSHTLVDVTPTEVVLRYRPGPPDAPEGPAAERRLPRRVAAGEPNALTEGR